MPTNEKAKSIKMSTVFEHAKTDKDCESDDCDIIDNRNTVYESAALNGNLKILQDNEKEAITNRLLMVYAARRGHIEIVKWCKEKGYTNYDDSMWDAALGNHVEIVKMCKKWGARDFNGGLERAAAKGHLNLVELFIEWGADYFYPAIKSACSRNFGNVIELLHSKQPSARTALTISASLDNTDIMKLCKKLGVNDDDISEALQAAAELCNLNALELLFSWGVKSFEIVWHSAILNKSIAMVKLCKKFGAIDATKFIEKAMEEAGDKSRVSCTGELTENQFIESCKAILETS